MSSTYAASFDRLHECVDELAAIDPSYRTTSEKQDALLGWSQFIARAEAERMRVLAVADDIAETTGDRCTAAWLATMTRDAPGAVRRTATLATALDRSWTQTAAAFAAGTVNLAQVRVIAEALDALPEKLGDDLRAKAELLMLAEAANLGPGDLKVFGSRLLEYLAPDVAEEAEYLKLLTAERRANAATKLTTRSRGDGSTDINARVPDHAAGRLTTYLNAFTAPRRQRHWRTGETVGTPFGPLSPIEPADPAAEPVDPGTPDEFANLPLARQRGIAFVALLENVLSRDLPRHGGIATSVAVLVDYDTLVADVTKAGIATTSTGQSITAGNARRLACQAGIYPVVLGGESEILDQGREARLVNAPTRKALNVRDKTCTTIGCTMPAEFCEAHHEVPWSRGGKTSLEDCKLLCPFHHHRAHDPGWITHHLPHHKTSFTRRQ
jgi:hypothetical protein